MAYLYPFGATQPENLEIIRDDTNADKLENTMIQATEDCMPMQLDQRGPLFIFHDQEPLDISYNKPLLEYITANTRPPWILVTTERNSDDGDAICKNYPFARIDYFFHIFAATDWFRGHEYLPGLIAPKDRTIKKTYITFNRLTSNKRIYRSLLINELYKNNLLESGYVSYSKVCPDGGSYEDNLRQGVPDYHLNPALVEEAITNIKQVPDLRIDFSDHDHIPNQSMLLSPMKELMESFVFLVTETCFFQTKTHLTEKIFKPIVLRMPFVLVGCAHNLEYLRSYGFKTFGDFWDESYDTIEDPIDRLQAIVKILAQLDAMSAEEQMNMLLAMQPILEHNYNLFNNPAFVRSEWEYLKKELYDMCQLYKFKKPYRLNNHLGQAIPIAPNES